MFIPLLLSHWNTPGQLLTGGMMTNNAIKAVMSPVRVLSVIPGSARPDPDDGRPVINVRGQRGVQLPVLLRDPPTLNSHLQS